MSVECMIGSGTYELPNMYECLRTCNELSPEDDFVGLEVAGELTPSGQWATIPTYICPSQIERFSLFDYALQNYQDSQADDYWSIVVDVVQESFVRAFVEPAGPADRADWERIVERLDQANLTSGDIDFLRDLAEADLLYIGERELFYNLVFGDEEARSQAMLGLRRFIVMHMRDQDSDRNRIFFDLGDGRTGFQGFWVLLARILRSDYVPVVSDVIEFDPEVREHDLATDWFYFVNERISLDYLYYLSQDEISQEDREIFEETYRQLAALYHSFSGNSQEMLYLEYLLSRASSLGDKFGFPEDVLTATFWAAAFTDSLEIGRCDQEFSLTDIYTNTSLGQDIISLSPAELPWEIQQALDMTGYYDYVAANVERINFYANSSSLIRSPATSYHSDVWGYIVLFNRDVNNRVVNLSVYDDHWHERQLFEIAAALVHEVTHVQNTVDGLRDEREAFNVELGFLEAFLELEITSGRLALDSPLALQISREIITTRNNVVVTDEVLAENPQARGYPTNLAIENVERIDPLAFRALGYNPRETNILYSLIVRLLRPGTTFEASYVRETIDMFTHRTLDLSLSFIGQNEDCYVLSPEEVILFERFILDLRSVTQSIGLLNNSESINMPGIFSFKDAAIRDCGIWPNDEDSDRFERALNAGQSVAGIRVRERFVISSDAFRGDIHGFNRLFAAEQYLADNF